MNFLLNLALVLQVLSAVILVAVILIQHGKGADMGASFGGGASGATFGSSGSANFMSHATAILAVIFLGTTLALAHFGYSVPNSSSGGSVLGNLPITAPAAPASSNKKAPPAPAAPGAAVPESVVPAAAGQPKDANKPATPASGAEQQIPAK